MSNHDGKNADYGLLTQGNAAKRQLRQQKQRNVVMAICMVFTLVLCLYLALIIGSIRDKVEWNEAHSKPADDPGQVDDPSGDTDPTPGVDVNVFDVVKKSAADVHKGLLLQIDATHTFDFSANVNMSDDFVKISSDSQDFQLSTYMNDYYKPIYLNAVTYDALVKMCADFHTDTGHDDLYIVSAYRSESEQRQMYDNGKKSTPSGATEYHSGYSVGLSIRNRQTGASYKIYVDKTEYGTWLDNNSYKYGLILSENTSYAKNAYYEQTFRYVGKPAAAYIHEHNTDLSGYLTALYQTNPNDAATYIKVTVNGLQYASYYVAAAGNVTNVPIPKGCAETDYTISGDNVGGFIVTYKIG